ncbi:hypothetical protein ASPFODRAFT_205913 [Aspergillus luchuensis CBS 106.47]|uniref:Uncharacterized protein n=1 Tax=Aspergillus luchuensis (strain CBS 106.47) TaxID=1137211 RepID=A0A1M3TQI5_ASPLC|nr:hypothetical protein ASPFODRAFT_205913 [Aspergillus luchuensis CBS 106.47]
MALHGQSSAVIKQPWIMRWRMRKDTQPEPCPVANTRLLKVRSGADDTAVGAGPLNFEFCRLLFVPLIAEQAQNFEVS